MVRLTRFPLIQYVLVQRLIDLSIFSPNALILYSLLVTGKSVGVLPQNTVLVACGLLSQRCSVSVSQLLPVILSILSSPNICSSCSILWQAVPQLNAMVFNLILTPHSFIWSPVMFSHSPKKVVDLYSPLHVTKDAPVLFPVSSLAENSLSLKLCPIL